MKQSSNVPVTVFLAGVALIGAVLLYALNQPLWLLLWLGAWAVILVQQFGGADQAAGTLFVLAGAGSLLSAGVRLNPQQAIAGFDLVGFLLALILLVVALLAVLWRASIFVFVSRGGNRRHAFVYLLKWLLGMPTAFEEVRDGKVVGVAGQAAKHVGEEVMVSLRGTRMALSVAHGQAVVLEKNNEASRVVGPGLHFFDAGEYIRKVIITHARSQQETLNDVMTKDGISLKIDFSVSYRIEAKAPSELGKPYPFSEEACIKAAYNTGDWEVTILKTAEGMLRDKIASMVLDDLFEPRNANTYPVGQIREELTEKLAARAKNWGAVIRAVSINKIEMPEKVREQLLTRWRAGWVAQIRLELSRSVLKLVHDQTGQADPKVALEFLETILGSTNLESLVFGESPTDIKRDIQKFLSESAAMEAAQKPRPQSILANLRTQK